MIESVDSNIRDSIIIVDFGSQVTKLIARRIREFNVYCEVINLREFHKIKKYDHIKGIILSGGPATVISRKYPKVSTEVFKNIPILGICYGLQLITKIFKGKIKRNKNKREFGKAVIKQKKNSILTKNFYKNKKSIVWMSHQDAVTELPKMFINIASTDNSKFTAIQHKTKKIFGIQFHPEVTHTENGKQLIKNFIFNVCRAKKLDYGK